MTTDKVASHFLCSKSKFSVWPYPLRRELLPGIAHKAVSGSFYTHNPAVAGTRATTERIGEEAYALQIFKENGNWEKKMGRRKHDKEPKI